MIDTKHVIRQMVDFQKTAFNASFNTIKTVQTRTEKAMDIFVNQAFWIPEEWKGAYVNCSKAYHTGCDTFKRSVDEGFEKIESYVSQN
jgi:hypothetical protein